MRTKHGDFDDTYAPMPAGIDQQGRWHTRQPMAAEARTGTEDDEPRSRWSPLANVLAICWAWLTFR